MLSLFTLVLGLFLSAAWSHDEHIHTPRDLGTFEEPSRYARPKFRYWVPDASVDFSDIANDLESVKRAGAGGMELLGYYYYGATQSSSQVIVPSDWTLYGWGTESWRNLTLFTLKECKAKDLVLDFAIGPNQGNGVPAKAETEGLMMDLVPFNTSFPVSGAFSGQVPGWGAGEFVSASVGLVLQTAPANLSASPGFLGPVFYNGTNYTLDASSLLDVTSKVTPEGQLDLQLPQSQTDLEYRLFAFYQKFSEYRAQASPAELSKESVLQSPVTDYVQNGSWTPDHFSSKGAQVVIDFWEDNLLDDESRALFREVGNYGWEDSMEFGTGIAVWWAPTMLQKFAEKKGYEFNKYLPLLYSYVSSHPGPLPSPDVFYLDDNDQGLSFLHDYYEVLTILNRDYLTTLRDWLASSLASKLSAQVVYNLPMEMAANIPVVDVPECESLGFHHNVDAYRQFSGPANLAGKRVISNELGATQGAAYAQTLPELIWDVKLSIMGGVNEMVFHGYPFSGYYGNNSWPGYTTFFYRFSEMHGPRQPAWDYYDDYMNWTARMQVVSQSGVPKVDLALWVHDDVTYDIFSRYAPQDLQEYGFSYNYISPSNFDLKDAYVLNNTLGPDQQAFKAFVIRHNDTMTLAGVKTLKLWADQGLPLVFSGGLPSEVSTHSEAKNLDSIINTLEDLTALPNVHVVPADNLAENLVSIVGITPYTSVQSTRPWLTYWRLDEDASITFVILYNDATGAMPGEAHSTGTVTFATSGVPYMYDAWTGQKTPVLGFEETCDGIVIPLALEGNQTTVIAFHHVESSNATLYPSPTGLYASSVAEHANITEVITCAADVSSPLGYKNKSSVNSSSVQTTMALQNWTLIVEAWTAPTDAFEFEQAYPSIRKNTTFQLQDLEPWAQISDSLRNISGRGFYSTTFERPVTYDTSHGAILNLGYITHTARVWINGKQVPPLDPTRPIADVTDSLVPGSNSIEIIVATTLAGSVRRAWSEIETAATPVRLAALVPEEQHYGLLYPVEIIPCRRTSAFVG